MKRRNISARNFGLGSRCLVRSGHNALRESGSSFVTQAVDRSRWQQFCNFVQERYSITDLRKINRAHIVHYSEHLKHEVESGNFMPSTAHDYLAAVNKILQIARGDSDLRVTAAGDAGFTRRSFIANESKATSESIHHYACQKLTPHLAAILALQRAFGLRFEESLKIDASKALKQALASNSVEIVAGTKGGRSRTVPITNESQIKALEKCIQFQGHRKSLIPDHQTYAEFKRQCYREIEGLSIKFHGERHWYANSRYLELTGVPSPAEARTSKRAQIAEIARLIDISLQEAMQVDLRARETISEELGHSRPEITNNYLG